MLSDALIREELARIYGAPFQLVDKDERFLRFVVELRWKAEQIA